MEHLSLKVPSKPLFHQVYLEYDAKLLNNNQNPENFSVKLHRLLESYHQGPIGHFIMEVLTLVKVSPESFRHIFLHLNISKFHCLRYKIDNR